MPLSLWVTVAGRISVEARAKATLLLQYPKNWLDSHYEGTLVTNRSHMTEVLVQDLKWTSPGSGNPSVQGALGQLSAIQRHYVSRARLQSLKTTLAAQGTPILIIVGSEDSLVRIQNSDVLAELLDSRIIRVEGAGHMIHYQLPTAFNSIVLSHFLTGPSELPSIPHSAAAFSPHASTPTKAKL